ncbi:MAG: hypothetical protein AAF799_25925 [Myxococcota bacterium]
MSQPIAEIVDPHALSATERERFTDDLYAAHNRIFAGVSRAEFAAYVVDSPAEYTRIQVLRVDEEIVGYAAFHAFERDVEGGPALVLRAEVGMLAAYRRQSRCAWFLAGESLRAIMRHPGRMVWGLSCATNPATYRTLARHADQVWPHWQEPTPSREQKLMDELAEDFQLRPVDPQRPGVYHVGWQTRQSTGETRDWRDCPHPASQLYLQRNPQYTAGHGLLLLVPLTKMGLFRAFGRIITNRIRRRFVGHRPQRMLQPQPSPNA